MEHLAKVMDPQGKTLIHAQQILLNLLACQWRQMDIFFGQYLKAVFLFKRQCPI